MLISNYGHKKVSDYLRKDKPSKVCLVFWHGLGDLIMFASLFNQLKTMFPRIKIDIALQGGVGQEKLIKNALLITSPNKHIDGYDYTFQIHFPMCEQFSGAITKAELCCREELGIDPISYYPRIKNIKKVLVACHFQATAVPGPVNVDEEIAKCIWDEVIEAGFIPIETLFKHRYYNPVNEKFGFIDRDVRGIPPSIPKLVSLLQSCFASICVASANLPLSLSIMPERTLYLQKEFVVGSYTKDSIATIDINEYIEGSVKKWLSNIR